MIKPICNLSIISFLTALMLSANAFSMNGFNEDEVLDLMKSSAVKTGIRIAEIIDAANDQILEDDMIRFMITDEGELFFLSDDGQLFALIAIRPIGEAEPKVIICMSDVDALRQRCSGIACFTDDLSSEEALSDNFEFNWSQDSSKTLDDFVAEYEEMHPELRKAKRALQRLYSKKNNQGIKRHKLPARE